MIELDGAYGEGGGQIVRTALALSVLTLKPFSITNIRAGRKSSGLKAQHVAGIKLVEQLTNSVAEHDGLGSSWLTFYPRAISRAKGSVAIGTAGSVTLLLQSVLLPCCFASRTVTLSISGGTDVKWSMPVNYVKEVLFPVIRPLVEFIDMKVLRRGYFPKGGGTIEVRITPRLSRNKFTTFEKFLTAVRKLPKINRTIRGDVIIVKGVSHASKDLMNNNVAERQASMIKNGDVRVVYADASTGSGITLWAVCDLDEQQVRIGADALGSPSKTADSVGHEAFAMLQKVLSSDAPVDKFLADNLIPFLGLIGGKIRVEEISSHTRTNMFVVEQFLGKRFVVEGNTIRTA
jgi:RNA 3'-terminal phosphate cyclase (GTP)